MTKEVDVKSSEVRVRNGGDWVMVPTKYRNGRIIYETFNNRAIFKVNGRNVAFIWELESNARQKLVRARHDGHDVIIRDDPKP